MLERCSGNLVKTVEMESICMKRSGSVRILFQLAPTKLSEEILKQATRWTSYQALKDHLLALQHLRTSGPTPMIYNLEEQEPEGQDGGTIMTEDGELLRLERRDGKQVAVRPPPTPHPQQRPSKVTTKTMRERHACGRPGHFRRDCTWSKHKDGGPLRPPPTTPK